MVFIIYSSPATIKIYDRLAWPYEFFTFCSDSKLITLLYTWKNFVLKKVQLNCAINQGTELWPARKSAFSHPRQRSKSQYRRNCARRNGKELMKLCHGVERKWKTYFSNILSFINYLRFTWCNQLAHRPTSRKGRQTETFMTQIIDAGWLQIDMTGDGAWKGR